MMWCRNRLTEAEHFDRVGEFVGGWERVFEMLYADNVFRIRRS